MLKPGGGFLKKVFSAPAKVAGTLGDTTPDKKRKRLPAAQEMPKSVFAKALMQKKVG